MSLALALRDPSLRRLQTAGALSGIAVWGWPSVLFVLVFQRDGAAAVGTLLAVRNLWAALVTPWMGAWCDRARRERLLLLAYLVHALTILFAGLLWWSGAPLVWMFVAVLLDGTVTALLGPAHQGLLPWLAKTASELTAANGVGELIAVVSLATGPGLGALGLALADAELVFIGYAAMSLSAAVAIASLRVEIQNAPGARVASSFWADSMQGVRSAARDPHLRFALGLLTAAAMAGGIVGVVVNPLAIDLLGMGKSGPPLLNAAMGVGAGAGGFALTALERRLSLGLLLQGGLGLVGWVWACAAATPSVVAVTPLLVVAGAGVLLVNVAGASIVQRVAPPEQMSRVISAQSLLTLLGSGLGAVLAPPMLSLLHLRPSMLALGCALLAIGVLVQTQRSSVDRTLEAQTHALDVLETNPLFTPLPVAVREGLANSIEAQDVRAGNDLVREGEEGSRFYMLESGEFDVWSQGRLLRHMTAPDFFGEIALLESTRRTATVRATTNGRVWHLGRDAFLAAISGHRLSRERAHQIVAERMHASGSGLLPKKLSPVQSTVESS